MDLRKSLADANIVRVALINDDLSDMICSADLRRVDNMLEDLLVDTNDPDQQAYIATLRRLGYNPADLPDLAAPLSEQAVRTAAPECLQNAVKQVSGARRGSAEPFDRVKALLIDSGIDPTNIDSYHGIELPQDKYYDLIIVDYYLVNDATDKTVPFICHLIESHANQLHPLQLIMMSSHKEGLKQDFRNLRPDAGVSSSRMSILAKPRSDVQLAAWKLTLVQLATDRKHVVAIESFVKNIIDAMNRAAQEQSRKLWGLGLQAMKLLHETATGDNDNFSRYVEECLSRYMLTHVTQS